MIKEEKVEKIINEFTEEAKTYLEKMGLSRYVINTFLANGIESDLKSYIMILANIAEVLGTQEEFNDPIFKAYSNRLTYMVKNLVIAVVKAEKLKNDDNE